MQPRTELIRCDGGAVRIAGEIVQLVELVLQMLEELPQILDIEVDGLAGVVCVDDTNAFALGGIELEGGSVPGGVAEHGGTVG